MDLMISNHTWELANLPKESRTIRCKYMFRRKYLIDGTQNNYKDRLVTMGFRQKECVDYFDTYALVEST